MIFVILLVVEVFCGDRLVGLVSVVWVRLRLWILVCIVRLKFFSLFGKVCVSVVVVWFLEFISVSFNVLSCDSLVFICSCEVLCFRVFIFFVLMCKVLCGLSLVFSIIMVVISLVSEVIGMIVLVFLFSMILLEFLLSISIWCVFICRCVSFFCVFLGVKVGCVVVVL